MLDLRAPLAGLAGFCLIASAASALAENAPGGPVAIYKSPKELQEMWAGKGGAVFDEKSAPFFVRAAIRTEPGPVENHLKAYDVVYFVEGSALFVTGGTVTDAKRTSAEEIVGKTIVGGDERKVGPGDVAVLKPGCAHWFKEVHGQIRYVVVHMP